MAARMAGYTGDHAALYAASIEFIHTATLVHDDIIDDCLGAAAWRCTRAGATTSPCSSATTSTSSMSMALTHDTLDIVRLLCDDDEDD